MSLDGGRLGYENARMNTTLPKLLRRREVEAEIGLSRTTIYRLMAEGNFPRPIRVGPKAVRWPRAEIEVWLQGRPRGGTQLAS